LVATSSARSSVRCARSSVRGALSWQDHTNPHWDLPGGFRAGTDATNHVDGVSWGAWNHASRVSAFFAQNASGPRRHRDLTANKRTGLDNGQRPQQGGALSVRRIRGGRLRAITVKVTEQTRGMSERSSRYRPVAIAELGQFADVALIVPGTPWISRRAREACSLPVAYDSALGGRLIV